MDTVKENRKGSTQVQYDRAVKPRSLYHELGAPPLDNFKGFVKMGRVQNCPIRIEDIKIAQNIFGPDMATLKGKSTRKKPKPVLEDWIELPKEILEKHRRIELCIDVMYINGVGLMTAVDQTIKYRSVEYIESKHASVYMKALSVIASRLRQDTMYPGCIVIGNSNRY